MAILNDLTLQQIITRAVAFLVFVMIHGGLVALGLRAVGSMAPLREGRAGANPVLHLSVWGLFMAVLFRAGWLRPFRVDANETGRLKLVLVAIGASVLTLVIVPAADLLRPLIASGATGTTGQFAQILIDQLQEITVGSVVLGLVPLPAVMGGRLLLVATIPRFTRQFQSLEGPATFLLVAAMIAAFEPVWIGWMLPLLSLVR